MSTPEEKQAALEADAARWRYVAAHWSSVQMRWNRDAANSFKGMTWVISAAANSTGEVIEREIDSAIAAAGQQP